MAVLVLAVGCSSGSVGSSGGVGALVSITVTPTNPSIAPGTMQQFTATGNYSDNTKRNLTTSASWGSSSTSVAAISNSAGFNGQASSLATGSTTITASFENITGSTTLTVTSAKLASLSVMPVDPSVTAGSTEQFSATGTFSDSTTQVVTSVVTWSSSSTSVATISNIPGSNGLASALTIGSSLITALSGSVSNSTTLTVAAAVNNVVPITVNGSLCSSGSYLNKPCVSVTVCTPGTATCQTITDLLLDTGSYGLRIFKQALTVSLTQVTAGSGSLAECVTYADGSAQWGPVQRADITLGGEKASNVPLQVIDSTFFTPTNCSSPQTSPAAAGFNGILGVGLFAEDCGTACTDPNNLPLIPYYTCNGSTCSHTTVALTDQVQNPVASLTTADNNGVIVQLPGVSLGGTNSVNGKLILGIGTQPNNTPSGVTTYAANGSGNFITVFNGSTLSTSFIDSGSNGLFFPSGAVSACASPNSSWYCPSSTTSLSATNKGAGGSPSGPVSFQIGNFVNLASTSNSVFVEIGGSFPGSFDWGLPFFFGRSVFVGIDGKTSTLGTGPYWAY